MELLDAILTVSECERAEQLKTLPPERKASLARLVEERVPSGLATLEEWNEVLKYLADIPPENDKKIAKKKILCILRGEEYKEEHTENEKINCGSRKKALTKQRTKKL